MHKLLPQACNSALPLGHLGHLWPNTITRPKAFEIWLWKLKLDHIILSLWLEYRHPSADAFSFDHLSGIISLNCKMESIILGDLNSHWLNGSSNYLEQNSTCWNFSQLINEPMHSHLDNPSKSIDIDLICSYCLWFGDQWSLPHCLCQVMPYTVQITSSI